jgi:hypothetical protein
MILLGSAGLQAVEPMVRAAGTDAAETVGAVPEVGSALTPMTIFGVQVFIDPETGLMRTPTPEEAAALAKEMQRQFGGPAAQTKGQMAQVKRADGSVMMEVGPDLMNFSVAHVLPDGTVTFDCVKGDDHGASDAAPSPAGAETE